MKATIRLAIVLVMITGSAIFLNGCSPNAPGKERPQQIIGDEIESQSRGRITLRDFTITNEDVAEIDEIQTHAFSYEGNIEVVRACFLGPFNGKVSDDDWEERYLTYIGGSLPSWAQGKSMIQCTEGRTIPISGKLEFEFRDGVWKVSRHEKHLHIDRD